MERYAMSHFETFIPKITTYFMPNINSQYVINQLFPNSKNLYLNKKRQYWSYYNIFKFKHIKLEAN